MYAASLSPVDGDVTSHSGNSPYSVTDPCCVNVYVVWAEYGAGVVTDYLVVTC